MCIDVRELYVSHGTAALYSRNVVCTHSGESSDLVGSSGREVTAENWREIQTLHLNKNKIIVENQQVNTQLLKNRTL